MSKNKDAAVAKPVLEYIVRQNRPYSVIDIFNNLHKEYGKTAVVRALDQLVEEGKIKEKTYGKQKIYFPEQSQFPAVDDEDLQKMDAEVKNMTGTLEEITQGVRSNEALLSKLNSSLTTSEAKEKLSTVKQEISALEAKLSDLESNAPKIDPAEKDAIYANNEKYVKEWRKRKRLTTDMVDAILEGYPKGKKTLFEEIGIETDEDAKVSLP